MARVFKVGELRQLIKESANEFKAVYGGDVQNDNKKINRQAYNAIRKETSAYDGGLTGDYAKGKKGTITPTENRGMSDIDYDGISKPFKDNVQSQIKGYTSSAAEKAHKNDPFGNADFGDEKQSKFFRDHAKEAKKTKDSIRNTGLTGSTKNRKDIEKQSDTMFESKKIKNLRFKHTVFLSEGHMLSKVPDDYKKDGNRFMMSDSDGNSYIVEWNANREPDVEKQLNKKAVNEEMNRIKQLYNYHSKDHFNNTTSQSRIHEDKEFSDMIGKARKLMK